ncbi:pyrophosphohydrolase domain-containing protein [Klebsiella aerogenes]|uniref:phosphoribosyl-ATP pyrophosphohydrolase n=1 Tax=Klebsiella aerogenes TaxID=548 RepID=UPI000D9B0B5D|nr:phosphoribosyl-ATP pyrophosphohydrolase [Klebsiella aerogenes]PYZ36488.1 phosphoribosyl-ATP pyrophosphohydrolase [Klebsiella aerogenes]
MLKKVLEKSRLKSEAKNGAEIDTLYEIYPGGIDITMKIGEMVSEFHELFQHPIAADITPELLELRARLIREEAVDEAAEAVEHLDMYKVLDAMADGLYVGIGTLISLRGGVANAMAHFTKEQSEGIYTGYVHAHSKKPQEDIILGLSQFGVAVEELEIIAAKIRSGYADSTSLAVDLRGAMNRIYVASQMVYHLADLMNVPVVDLVAEVHRSNMTKLWPADAELRTKLVAKCKYDKDDLAFRVAEGRDGMIGYRISDGKILKSPTYDSADLSRFVDMAMNSIIGRHFF